MTTKIFQLMTATLERQKSVKKFLDKEDFHVIPYWPCKPVAISGLI